MLQFAITYLSAMPGHGFGVDGMMIGNWEMSEEESKAEESWEAVGTDSV